MCGNLHSAEQREWLVTNGIGGFASGTIAGSLTRRYHGLLIAALHPPLGRTLLVAKLDETVEYDGELFSLATNRWSGGFVDPSGYRYLERFHLGGTIPVWTFAFADVRLQKRLWMEPGENTTYIRYDLIQASSSLQLRLKAFVNSRDYHGTTTDPIPELFVELMESGLAVTSKPGIAPFYLMCSRGSVESVKTWHFNFDLPVERRRGLPDREHHLHAGTWTMTLNPGEKATWLATLHRHATSPTPDPDRGRRAHEQLVWERYTSQHPHRVTTTPPWIQQLILAADQFIASRPIEEGRTGHTIIAGYHWFGDWGRDTMISLPGLTLTTGRFEVARSILLTFAQYTDQGMLPNRFSDTGEKPEYNTVDATLWFFEACRQYYDATKDRDFLKEIYPVLADIIEWHKKGTRYEIGLDPADGLLRAGEAGVQLTWMDAKVGDWVVTPRIGKPIEINALWLNALTTLIHFSSILKNPTEQYETLQKQILNSFQRFWNEREGICFDVIDGPQGDDSSPRPNQLFAVSLPNSPLQPNQRRAVVDFCARRLLTSYGLRSLAPTHPDYVGRYAGNPRERDGAYHQGTVWGWLIGAYVIAHLRVYHNPKLALSFLEPFAYQLNDFGLGTAGEIFDGDPSFTPRGCIAQAWTVAEILRAWEAIDIVMTSAKNKTKRQHNS